MRLGRILTVITNTQITTQHESKIPSIIQQNVKYLPKIIHGVTMSFKIFSDGSPSTSNATCEYNGSYDVINKRPHGYGTAKWSNGITYFGGFKDGIYHGPGKVSGRSAEFAVVYTSSLKK